MKEKLNNTIIGILGFFIKILGIALIIILGIQIVSRYLPSVKCVWTEELSRLLFVWYAMLSVAVAYIENKHLSLDIFYEKMNPKVQRFLDGFELALTFIISVVIVVKGFKLLETVKIQTSPILQLPMNVFYGAVPAGFVFIAVFSFLNLVEYFMEFIKKGGRTDAS